MKYQRFYVAMLGASILLSMSACVSKKKYLSLQKQVESHQTDLKAKEQSFKAELEACSQKCKSDIGVANGKVEAYKAKLETCENEKEKLAMELKLAQAQAKNQQEQITDLKQQSVDLKQQRDKQFEQIGGLTVLSQSANNNIAATLSQLEKKDKYIHLLQAAKTKTDSLNLALAVNLKSVLKDGLNDQDVEIKVDKTVVFINISDKMLFQSGSAVISDKAAAVLGKIAKIIESRPDLEVMVEGNTDNVPIKTTCLQDNWDLSVQRASAVVRALQKSYGVVPARLIAAGRSEYSPIGSNDTAEGRATNRRTRIILMPKLDQFYDLLNPNNVPK